MPMSEQERRELDDATEIQNFNKMAVKTYCFFAIIAAAITGLNIGFGLNNLMYIMNGNGNLTYYVLTLLQVVVAILSGKMWYNNIKRIYEFLNDMELTETHIERCKTPIW